jgi:hypothetical protein
MRDRQQSLFDDIHEVNNPRNNSQVEYIQRIPKRII